MEYQFSFDIYEKPIAKLSMGHEVIGRWLSDEVSNNQQTINQILDIISQLERAKIFTRRMAGKDFEISFNQHDVEITTQCFGSEFADALPEDTHIYEQESYAECGLQDFKQLLTDWQRFIK